ncbi:hypothetical protein Q9R29_03380 [Rothia sp. ARF10]|nr:hypothetical protein [Rothia sp. ARF10]
MTRPPRRRTTCLAGAITLALAGCASGSGEEQSPPPTTSGSPSASPSSTHPGAGRPDPDGRIVFGRITRIDDLYGQVVSLWAVDPDGSDEVQLTKGESAYPDWSPRGDRIAYTAGLPDGSWQVATMAPDGTDVRVLTSGPGVHDAPSWTPDGSALVYSYNPSGQPTSSSATLWRMNADGSSPARTGSPNTIDVEPRVSPDGRSVVFMRGTFQGAKLATLTLVVRDLTTGAERSLPAAGKAPEHPDWTPDGASIVYNVWSGFTDAVPKDQVEQVPADGSGRPTVLFAATASRAGFKPSFSPDGTRIVFGCAGVVTGKDSGTCVMNADGTGVRVVTDNPAWEENHFSWGPTLP